MKKIILNKTLFTILYKIKIWWFLHKYKLKEHLVKYPEYKKGAVKILIKDIKEIKSSSVFCVTHTCTYEIKYGQKKVEFTETLYGY